MKVKGFKSIQSKLVVYFVLLSFTISLITGILQTISSSHDLLQNKRNEVMQLAAAASLLIDGDAHEQLKTSSDQDSSTFNDIKNKLLEFQKKTGVTYVYTLVENGSDKNVSQSANELSISTNDNQKSINEISSSIQNIAAGASNQANSINDIYNKVQSISSDITESDKKMNQINTSIDQTKHLITIGLDAVHNQNIKTVENLEAFEKVTEAVENLVKKSKEVESILGTITSISEQTNLLALNAAIEAARAGEHGKGFSVVADEVRKLAEGTTTAAGEIGQILQKISADANQAIKEINNANTIAKEQKSAVMSTDITFKDMKKEIENMISSIDIIGNSFKNISNSTYSMTAQAQEISSISQENAAIAQEVAACSEQQNATMEEINATAHNLNQLSQKLEETISVFSV